MKKKVPDGYVEVICRYITKNGKKVYPRKAKYFRFFALAKK